MQNVTLNPLRSAVAAKFQTQFADTGGFSERRERRFPFAQEPLRPRRMPRCSLIDVADIDRTTRKAPLALLQNRRITSAKNKTRLQGKPPQKSIYVEVPTSRIQHT